MGKETVMALSPEETKDWSKRHTETCSYCGQPKVMIRRGRNKVWQPRYRRYVSGYWHVTHHKCAEGERFREKAKASMDRANGLMRKVL